MTASLTSTLRAAVAAIALVAVGTSIADAQGSPQIFSATYATAFQDLDPATASSNENAVLANVYETLVWYVPGRDGAPDRLNPSLATHWDASEDGLTWTFTIRDGVTFHDGTALTAAAVKQSIDRTIALGGGLAFIWDPVDHITAPDERTVVFHLTYAAPVDLMASASYAAWIHSPAAADKDSGWFNAGNSAGTGAYRIRDYAPGERVVLELNDDYWGETSDRPFRLAVLDIVEDPVLREQKLKSGETDWVETIEPDNVALLDAAEGVAIVSTPSFQNFAAHFNTAKPPLNDVRVRQALSHAFPRDDYLSLMGRAAMPAVGPLPATLPGHATDAPLYAHDLDRAAALLAEAGVEPATLELSFTYTTGLPEGERAAELYKASLAQIGVTLDIQPMLWEAQWALAKSDPAAAQDIFAMFWWPSYVTPYDFLYSLYHSEDAPFFNLSYYRNPAFDTQIDTAAEQMVTDRAAALATFSQASTLIAQDAVSLFLLDKTNLYGLRADIEGYRDNPAYSNVVDVKSLMRAE